MKLDKTYLLGIIARAETLIKRFRFIIVFAVFSLMYGYLLLQVNITNNREPDVSQIKGDSTSAPRSKIDPNIADKITSLEEENIDIKAIFNEARKNPFTE